MEELVGSSEKSDRIARYFQEHRQRFIEEWMEWLRIPSISTDSAYAGECRQAAEWLKQHLEGVGFVSELIETDSKPIIYAEYHQADAQETVLFYGHYDVQPADPIEEWISPPFEPELRGTRVYARGALDNKGQVFFVVKALEYLISHDLLGASVKILIEGEEECGSTALGMALNDPDPRWKADTLLVCDTGIEDPARPAITMGLRGISSLNFRIRGPKNDLHSGAFGGMVANPAHGMASVLASLWDQEGRIAVPGFYDGVEELTDQVRPLIGEETFNVEQLKAVIGVDPVGGEQGRGPMERMGFRPTVEVNGVWSGYQGEGSKTIIPAVAEAKLSCRFVPGQDPEALTKALAEYLVANTPNGLECEILEASGFGDAVAASIDAPAVVRSKEILDQMSGGNGSYIWFGGSIPIISELATVTGGVPLLVGFGLIEDNMHAPNESFDLGQFEQGFTFVSNYLGV